MVYSDYPQAFFRSFWWPNAALWVYSPLHAIKGSRDGSFRYIRPLSIPSKRPDFQLSDDENDEAVEEDMILWECIKNANIILRQCEAFSLNIHLFHYEVFVIFCVFIFHRLRT